MSDSGWTTPVLPIVTPDVADRPDAADDDDDSWEGLLGQGSNSTARAIFDLISTDICRCILVICDGSITVPAYFATGDVFTWSDIEEISPNRMPVR